jgi:N6-adenosine-specific RNA methylase IME4
MTGLVPLDAARRLLAEARDVFETKVVRDKAEAIRAYARLACDRELEISAAELRVRAERRIGEILAEIKAAGGLDKRRHLRIGPEAPSGHLGESLADLGIDKKLSMRAQAYAALAEAEFESRIAEWRDVEARRRSRAVASLFKAIARPAPPRETPPLPAGKYGAILADPPWRFETWSQAGLDRAADNHYPTMSTREIMALSVAELAADDCVLFLWELTSARHAAMAVLDAWGFFFRTVAFVWAKEGGLGLGYWTRHRCELCLLATRGQPKRLDAGVDQLVAAPRGRHSEKPEEIAARIERLVAGPYIELFARKLRPGWDAWGNEIDSDSTHTEPADD